MKLLLFSSLRKWEGKHFKMLRFPFLQTIMLILLVSFAYSDIDWGTETEFDSGGGTYGIVFVRIAEIGTDKLVVCYCATDESYDGTCRVATVSGTTFTWGSKSDFDLNIVAHTSHWLDVCRLDDDKFVVIYNEEDNNDGYARVGSVSGTTISWGTPKSFEDHNLRFASCSNMGTDRFVACYLDDGDDDGKCVAMTVSGTTITAGSVYEHSTANSRYTSTVDLDDDKFLHCFNQYGGSADQCVVGEVTWGSRSISYGSHNTFTSNDGYPVGLISMGTDRFGIAVADVTDTRGIFIPGNVTGTTINYGNDIYFHNDTTNNIGITNQTDTTFVIGYCDQGDANDGKTRYGRMISWEDKTAYINDEEEFTSHSTGGGNDIGFDIQFINTHRVVVCYQDNDDSGDPGQCMAGIINDSLPPSISITSIGGDSSAPYSTSDSTPAGIISTDENADCRGSLDGDEDYDDMLDDIDCTGDGGTSHTCQFGSIGDTSSQAVYFACKDHYGNENSDDNNSDTTVEIDTVVPDPYNYNPANTSTITDSTPTFTFSTDETGDCFASTDGDEGYDDMSDDVDCTAGVSTSHSCTMYDLGADGTKNIYIACKDDTDSSPNKDTASTNEFITYTLDTTPPTITIDSIGDDTSAGWSISDNTPLGVITTNENADCRASVDGDESYDDMSDDIDCTGDGGTSHNCQFISAIPDDDSLTMAFACQDSHGNKNTDANNNDASVDLDTIPPDPQSFSPASGSTITDTTPTFTFTTGTEISNCSASLNDESYDEMSDDVDCTANPLGDTSHSCTMPNLEPDCDKYIYIACADWTEYYGNKDTSATNEFIHYILDAMSAVVTLEYPLNATTITKTKQPKFHFNVSDIKAEYVNCSLWIENGGLSEYNRSDELPLNHTLYLTPDQDLGDGTYLWRINCTDGYRWNFSIERELTIAYVNYAPGVTLNLPVNNTFSPLKSIILNATVYDPDDNATAYFYVKNESDSIWTLINTQSGILNNSIVSYFWGDGERTIEHDMILYYKFNNQSPENYNNSNGSLIYDHSNYHINGTLYTGSDYDITYSSGKYSGGYIYQHNDKIEIPFNKIHNFTEFSISAWINPNDAYKNKITSIASKWGYDDTMDIDDFSNFSIGTLDSDFKAYFGGLYDGRYVYFIPYKHSSAHGNIVRYDTSKDFEDVNSWQNFSLTSVNANLKGYQGGAFDGQYIYLVPHRTTAYHGYMARYDTFQDFTSTGSYEFFDVGTIDTDLEGFNGGIYDGRYVYYIPYDSDSQLMRYDTSKSFTTSTSWENFSLESISSDFYGFLGSSFDGKYIYMSPYYNTFYFSDVIRYDTTKDFTDPSSYNNFSMASIDGNFKGYGGSIYDGRYVYFTPQYTDNFLRYDTTNAFTDKNSWENFSLDMLRDGFQGYRGGSFDGRFIYLTPYTNQSDYNGNFIKYDTLKDFEDASSYQFFMMHSIDNDFAGYDGGVFDGRYIYNVPFYNGDDYHDNVVRYDTNSNGVFALRYSGLPQDGGYSSGAFGSSFRINTENISYAIYNNTNLSDSWHHLLGIFNLSEISFYIDGNLQGKLNVTGTINNMNKLISVASDGNTSYYNGSIDELIIYDRALSQYEAEHIYKSMAEGKWFWKINLTDERGLTNTSIEWMFTLDWTSPDINFTSPTPINTSISDYWVYVNLTSNEDLRHCILEWNYTVNYTMLNITRRTWHYNISGVIPNNYSYTATCNDSAGHWNYSERIWTYLDDIFAPSIVNWTPPNNTVDYDGNLTFSYYAIDHSPFNCSLYINLSFVQSMISVNGSTNYFPSISLQNGSYNWSINCTDIWGNANNSVLWLFNVSIIEPPPEYPLNMTKCPTTVSESFNLSLIFFIAVVILVFAFWFKVPFLGFFAGILFMIYSWYLAPCIAIYAYVMALFGVLISSYFAITGIKFHGST